MTSVRACIALEYANNRSLYSFKQVDIPSCSIFNAFALERLEVSPLVFATFVAVGFVGPVVGALNTIFFTVFVPDSGCFPGGGPLYTRPCILPRMATPLTQRIGRSWLQSSPDFRHFAHGIRD